MNETNTQENSQEKKAEGSASRLPMTIIGSLLLIVAAFLYVMEIKSSSRAQKQFELVKTILRSPIASVAMRTAEASETSGRYFMPCPPAFITNLVASVENSSFEPKVKTERKFDLNYDLIVYLTNHTKVAFRLSRDKSAEEAYLFLRDPRGNAKDPQFVEFSPIKLGGLNSYLNVFDKLAVRQAETEPFIRKADKFGFTEESIKTTDASVRHLGTLPLDFVIMPTVLKKEEIGKRIMGFSRKTSAEVCELLKNAQASDWDITKTAEGQLFNLTFVIDAGKAMGMLRVAILDASPEDAMVGFVENNAVSAPALVPGLGTVLKPYLKPAETDAAPAATEQVAP